MRLILRGNFIFLRKEKGIRNYNTLFSIIKVIDLLRSGWEYWENKRWRIFLLNYDKEEEEEEEEEEDF